MINVINLLLGLFLLVAPLSANAVTAGLVTLITGVTGFAATAIAAAATFAISFGASYLLAKKYKGSAGAVSAADLKQMVRGEKEARRVIYGKRQASGIMIYAEEQDGAQDEGENLYMAVYVCDHPVHSYSNIMLDDKDLSEYGGDASVSVSNGDRTGIEFMKSVASQWEDDMVGDKVTWIACNFNFNPERFTGIPTPKITVEGKEVYDYRDGQYKYSNNAAMVIADFLVEFMNIPRERIITSGHGSIINAINLCDEIMDSGERRYTIDGMFQLDSKPSDILNEMLKSCGGTLVRSNGMIGLLPAAWYGAATFTLTESEVITGTFEVTPQESMSSGCNVISGSYVQPEEEWAEVSFPPIYDEIQLAEDGFEITEEITYDFVTTQEQAMRLANIELRRRSIGGFISLNTNRIGLYCRVGRVIKLNLPQLGIIGEYRVLEQVLSGVEVSLKLQRDEAEIYDDAVGEQYVPPATLPITPSTVEAPQSVSFQVQSIGDTIQGYVTWVYTSSKLGLVKQFDVEVIDANTNEVIVSKSTTSIKYNIDGLPLGTYTAKVRAVSYRGLTSAWTVGSDFAIGVPGIPVLPSISDGTLVRSNWNIEIIPEIAGGAPQGVLFEFWHIADTSSFLTGTPSYSSSDVDRATLVTTASSLNKGSLMPDRYQHFWIRSVSSYGKSAWVYVRTGTTREQDLVVTVVEKLSAITIESQNWGNETGYKLFSPADAPYTMPDGTVLDNPDGLAVFNNIVSRGHIVAKSLTFASDDSIPDNINNANSDPKGSAAAAQAAAEAYALAKANLAEVQANAHADGIVTEAEAAAIAEAQRLADAAEAAAKAASDPKGSAASAGQDAKDWTEDRIYPDQNSIQIKSATYIQGVSGWAISKNGNAEFNNVTVRGNGYFEDGYFKGAVYAEKIIGDVVSAKAVPINQKTLPTIAEEFYRFTVTNTMDKPASLVIDGATINAHVYLNTAGSGSAKLEVGTLLYKNGELIATTTGEDRYTVSGDNYASFTSVSFTEELAAGETNTYFLKAYEKITTTGAYGVRVIDLSFGQPAVSAMLFRTGNAFE